MRWAWLVFAVLLVGCGAGPSEMASEAEVSEGVRDRFVPVYSQFVRGAAGSSIAIIMDREKGCYYFTVTDRPVLGSDGQPDCSGRVRGGELAGTYRLSTRDVSAHPAEGWVEIYEGPSGAGLDGAGEAARRLHEGRVGVVVRLEKMDVETGEWVRQ